MGIFLTLWRVDGWVMIWSFLKRFWVSSLCFVDFIITSFIFVHEGLNEEFKMLGLIVETLVLGKAYWQQEDSVYGFLVTDSSVSVPRKS
jgi:hypothetical protein